MRQFLKKNLAIFCATISAVAMLPITSLTTSAADAQPETVTVLALGDDCLVAEDGDTAAVELIADYFDGSFQNDAQIGMTSTELWDCVQSDAAIQADIEEADVILLSAGYNDLMNAIFYENTYLSSAITQTTLLGVMQTISSSDPTGVIEYIVGVLPETVETINENLKNTVAMVQKLNSSANIVVQSVNNFMAVDFDEWEGSLSEKRMTAAAQVYFYLNACLEGGTYAYSGFLYPLTIDTGVNEMIESLENVAVADFYDAFCGEEEDYSGVIGLGFYLTNTANLDFTFTSVGQVLLAAAAIDADESLANGDGSVITAAYDATGERSYLETERPTLDDMITAAESQTLVTYTLGDIDCDGIVGLNDAYETLVNYAYLQVGIKSDFGPLQRRAADADNDGQLSINDAYLWLKYYACTNVGYTYTIDEFLAENGRTQ